MTLFFSVSVKYKFYIPKYAEKNPKNFDQILIIELE